MRGWQQEKEGAHPRERVLLTRARARTHTHTHAHQELKSGGATTSAARARDPCVILACSLASAAAAAARARSFSLPVSAGYESEVLSVGPCVLLASCLRIPSACVCPLSTGRRVRERERERERFIDNEREWNLLRTYSNWNYHHLCPFRCVFLACPRVCSLLVP